MAMSTIIFENLMGLLDETPESNNKIVQKYIKSKKNKRTLALYTIIKKKPQRRVPKCKQFIETIGEMPDDIFYSHFRMEISTFKKLYKMLQPLWRTTATGRPGIGLKESLYVMLWKLGNQNSFREISDRFNIGRGTAYRAFVKIILLINKLKGKVIKFPATEFEQEKTMQGFESSRSHPFPFVLGCIDGTHIRIMQPKKDSISFYNRKGTYSVVAQAVVNSEMQFMDVFVGYPGRCHDASIWKNCPLRRAIVNRVIRFPPECHLLGDAAYPLECFLMVPYKDNGFLTREQIRFNNIHSSTRVFVEQAFGILKKKFRILNYLEMTNCTLIKYVIMSCFILHNIILKNEGSNNFGLLNDEDCSRYECNNYLEQPPLEQDEAKRKRINLTTLLSA